jgi:16S rRNA G527 N7-methylase RsmG
MKHVVDCLQMDASLSTSLAIHEGSHYFDIGSGGTLPV